MPVCRGGFLPSPCSTRGEPFFTVFAPFFIRLLSVFHRFSPFLPFLKNGWRDAPCIALGGACGRRKCLLVKHLARSSNQNRRGSSKEERNMRRGRFFAGTALQRFVAAAPVKAEFTTGLIDVDFQFAHANPTQSGLALIGSAGDHWKRIPPINGATTALSLAIGFRLRTMSARNGPNVFQVVQSGVNAEERNFANSGSQRAVRREFSRSGLEFPRVR